MNNNHSDIIFVIHELRFFLQNTRRNLESWKTWKVMENKQISWYQAGNRINKSDVAWFGDNRAVPYRFGEKNIIWATFTKRVTDSLSYFICIPFIDLLSTALTEKYLNVFYSSSLRNFIKNYGETFHRKTFLSFWKASPLNNFSRSTPFIGRAIKTKVKSHRRSFFLCLDFCKQTFEYCISMLNGMERRAAVTWLHNPHTVKKRKSNKILKR